MKMYSAHNWKLTLFLRKKFEIERPFALGWGEWPKWEAKMKKEKPMGYFLTEAVPNFLDNVKNKLPTPISSIRYYCRNRFIRKTHVLPTGFQPGVYYDLDERILHGIMQALVDFVEIELAYKSRWSDDAQSKKAKWRDGRCPELGLAYLAWEMTLDDPSVDPLHRAELQAQTAREIKEIYDWWTQTRPARPDPFDASGWTILCDEKLNGGYHVFDKGPREFEHKKNKSLKLLRKIEERYEAEDQQMLIRVIKIRKNLWA